MYVYPIFKKHSNHIKCMIKVQGQVQMIKVEYKLVLRLFMLFIIIIFFFFFFFRDYKFIVEMT